MNIDSNHEVATKVQQKFEFYFIALIFTLLGLSVQTGTFGHGVYADLLEILGWLSFLLSGLFGLSRLEWVPITYTYYSQASSSEKKIKECKEHQIATGQQTFMGDDNNTYSINDLVSREEQIVSEIRTKTDGMKKKNIYKYRAQKGLFLLGLICIFASRSIEAIFNIIETLK